MAFETKTMSLGSFDTIVVYTDGVTEAANDGGEMYGEERLMESLKKTDRSSLQSLIDSSLSDVQGFAGNAPQADDITMLVLQFTG
jgi:sigma-B regulation protein RsbU (phosphoserine phosphatase)